MARKPNKTKQDDNYDRSAVPSNVNPTRENAEYFEKQREEQRKEDEKAAQEDRNGQESVNRE